jgi:hypothetical protein
MDMDSKEYARAYAEMLRHPEKKEPEVKASHPISSKNQERQGVLDSYNAIFAVEQETQPEVEPKVEQETTEEQEKTNVDSTTSEEV